MARKYLVFRDELERDYLKKNDMTAYASKDSVDELARLVAPFVEKVTAEYQTSFEGPNSLIASCEYLLLAYKGANIQIYRNQTSATVDIGPVAFLARRNSQWEMKDIFGNKYVLTSNQGDQTKYRLAVGHAVVYLIK